MIKIEKLNLIRALIRVQMKCRLRRTRLLHNHFRVMQIYGRDSLHGDLFI